MNSWHRSLSQKDRQILSAGVLFVILAIIYMLIYQPLEQSIDEGRMRLGAKQLELSKLILVSDEYTALGPVTGDASHSNDHSSLLSIIDQSGTTSGIKSSIKRLTPEGDHKVRVRVESVSFDKLLNWLVFNSSHNAINAELFLVSKTNQIGEVNATLLMVRR